jgi:hypothetical protein
MGTKVSGICSSSKLSWSPHGLGSIGCQINGLGEETTSSSSERREKVLREQRTSPTCAEDLERLDLDLNILERERGEINTVETILTRT